MNYNKPISTIQLISAYVKSQYQSLPPTKAQTLPVPIVGYTL